MYSFNEGDTGLEYAPERGALTVLTPKGRWSFAGNWRVELSDGGVLNFADAECAHGEHVTGVCSGVRASYSGFARETGEGPELTVHTYVGLDRGTGRLRAEIWVENEKDFEISALVFPGALEFGAKKGGGYTALPRMQGTLFPAGEGGEFVRKRENVLDRPAYMPIFGQTRGESGYLAVFDTPYDTAYSISHTESDTIVEPMFIPSLEKMAYRRSMLYYFEDGLGYVGMAKRYREYLKEKGRLATLREKAERNPGIKRLIGTPVVHQSIAVHIHEKSHYYKAGEPEKNDYYSTFESLALRLEKLREKGVERAYLHLDGWGNHGYDNLHPDPFPPHEAAGGAEGMRALSERCRALGYVFGIHDQYRDYYYDAPSFDFANAIVKADGSHPYCEVWYGGPHSYLCQALAPEYVRRNYAEFERLGIKIEGAYLDVFSVVDPDECFAPAHRVTREESVKYRNECFEILNARGIIPSSEEAVDAYIPSLALCHHAPFYIDSLGDYQNGKSVGVGIPFFSLVYHDCLVIPWDGAMSKTRGGWGCPSDEWNYLHALLNGGTVYVSPEAGGEALERVRTASELHARVGEQELTSHEFVYGDYKRQRSVFADGTGVEVDFRTDEYRVIYPEG